ncbi:hypothetical protein POTOM_008769 [Populus tomentosa]|uniref:Uncharacterized protein n=1 Tax=Populus tomentosa TaxID=118781 RepID=A0A8X8ACL7_POPTO|nr:hypothetical protein POTOM_008769 [Populus tomentosa]
MDGRGADDCLGGAGILRCKRPRARDDGSMVEEGEVVVEEDQKRRVKLTEKCVGGCNRLIKEVGDEQSRACLDEGETRQLLWGERQKQVLKMRMRAVVSVGKSWKRTGLLGWSATL